MTATAPRPTHRAPGTPGPGHPDPLRLARAVAIAWLEVEAGRRPLAHIRPLLSPAVALRVVVADRRRREAGVTAPGPAVNAIVRCHGQPDGDRALDAVVLVRMGQRVTAVVVRVERHRGAWRVVELARPEDGTQPARTASLPDHPTHARECDLIEEAAS